MSRFYAKSSLALLTAEVERVVLNALAKRSAALPLDIPPSAIAFTFAFRETQRPPI
jgi:hypothetical protein